VTRLADLSAALDRPRSLATLLGVSVAISLLYTLSLFPLGFLAGTSDYWQTVHKDVGTNLVGYSFFIKDEWRFPLFFTPHINIPKGYFIIYTDSIPILAVFAKAVYSATGIELPYFGFWYGLSYVLQGVVAALLIGEVTRRNLLAAIFGALFALTLPLFLFRFGHVALCGQFLLLLSLYLYVRDKRAAAGDGRFVRLHILLLLIALLVHAYLYAMCAAIFAASLGQSWIDGRRRPARIAAYAGAALLGSVVVMVLSGYIGTKFVPGYAKGLGIYSFNLLSPFYPQRHGGLLMQRDSNPPPGLGPIVDATGGQYEGYAYLGMGLLALLALLALTAPGGIWALVRRNAALAAIMGIVTLFAASNRVYWGDHLLFGYEYPALFEKIANQFRSTGRFIWPVVYVVLSGALVVTLRRFRPLPAALILAAAAALQFWDTAPMRRAVGEVAAGSEPFTIAMAAWEDLAGRHDRMLVYPSFECGRNKNLPLHLDFQKAAAARNVPINTLYVGRPMSAAFLDPIIDCRQQARDSQLHGLEPGTLYVLLDEAYSEGNLAAAAGDPSNCRRFAQGFACTRLWPEIDPAGANPAFRPLGRPE